MRPIEFRGKRVDNGEWLYGYFLKKTLCDGEGECSYIKFDGGSLRVIDETVGQFTGLKDENGKKIYEGDVVKWIDSDKRERIDFVKWKNGGMILCNAQYAVGVYLFNDLEIIGNIHDNPELIK
jgi:uncharacterized phage protein (TIGR01671 family)